jgi:ketosteroid isomerase-like protein
MNRCFPPTLLSALVLACAPPAEEASAPAAAAVDTAAVVAGVADLWAKWAVADTAEDLDAFGALMTETALFDAKGMPEIVGPAGMKAAAGPLYAQVDYLEATATPSMTVAISNEMAHQAGTYFERYTMKGQKGEMMDYGRYAAAFVKGADGQWKWAYMMAFVDSTVTKK